MKETLQGFSYNPQSPFTTPFTIISQVKQTFTSRPISLPCVYEVYCPYSCKKIKIGLTKNGKNQALQFNTTTNRIVTFYANDHIRYLVNKHRPNKKDKKNIEGQGWMYYIDVEDKGNIAIFNPYCVDPLNPLSFYTFDKISASVEPTKKLSFIPKVQREAIVLNMGAKQVYLSKNLRFIGPNKYFSEDSPVAVTITNPNNQNEQLTIETPQLLSHIQQSLSFLFNQLHKLLELETKSLEFNESFSLKYNVDELYEQISYYLNIQEQVRARFMNSSCVKQYDKYFKQHPRLYSGIQRLTSFLNYGNSKFNVLKLADAGFYNKSDMLQDLAYIQLPHQDLPSVEEEPVQNQAELRRKLFPFARMTRQIPFPNVPISVSLQSIHCQQTSQSQILKYETLNPYIAMVSKNSKVSIWSAELLVLKFIEFDYSKNYHQSNLFIPTKSEDIPKLATEDKKVQSQKVSQKVEAPVNPTNEEEAVSPDPVLLAQLQAMGYPKSVSIKALIETNNAEIATVIDAISTILKQKPAKKRTAPWICNICTFSNLPNTDKCQMCLELAPDEQEEELKASKIRDEQKKNEEKKKKEEELEKAKKQAQQKERLREAQKQKQVQAQKQVEQKYKSGSVKSISFQRSKTNHIDPFLISILLQMSDKDYVVRTFRVGLERKSLLKFYRIQESLLISNFTRQILKVNDLQSINELIGASRGQIQWGVRFFESPEENNWTVVGQHNLELTGTFTSAQYVNHSLVLYNNEQAVKVYQIAFSDTIQCPKFSLELSESKIIAAPVEGQEQIQSLDLKKQDQTSNKSLQKQFVVPENIEEVLLQVVEYLPAGQLTLPQVDKDLKISEPIYAQNLIMSEFIPLKIQTFEGSIFSHKYSPASILQKNNDKNNIYVSNYPNVNFVFKSIDNKPMLIESATVVSKMVKMSKIFPISSGLIFTANELSWFSIAKQKFSNFTKNDYDSWLRTKQSSAFNLAFWEPVAYFDISNEVQFQLNFKRIAKYVFLLPTSVNRKDNNDDVIALKIDFFGVKGRLEQQIPQFQLGDGCKNEGSSGCSLEMMSGSVEGGWNEIGQERRVLKNTFSVASLNFAPKYFDTYATKIPISATTTYHIKFKDLENSKRLVINSSFYKFSRISFSKQSKANLQNYSIKSFSDLIGIQTKLSSAQLENIVSKLDLQDLILSILKGPAEITYYENLFNKILGLQNFDSKIFQQMCQILQKLCQEDVVVTETGLKSFIRLYEKLIPLNEELSKSTIQSSWLAVTKYCLQTRNKNYNIIRNTYKIEELILESAIFSKDYYRLINPNYVEEEKALAITVEPQTIRNNRVFVEPITNFNYIYHIDLLGHESIENVNFYYPKLANQSRYKMCFRLMAINILPDGTINETQIFYRYFHEDCLLQLSSKVFKDTEIFQKTHINYLSVQGSIIPTGTRLLKLYFDLTLATTIPTSKTKVLPQPYVILPLIVSKKYKQPIFEQSQLPSPLQKMIDTFPTQTKHNSSLERMPPHRFACENRKYLYHVHDFKDKINEEIKNESINKIEKIIQNILDANIVNETFATIKINDYPLNHKGLDFTYILMINLMKMFRKLPSSYTVDVKTMFTLFDTFVVYECGPIKNQTSLLLTELYKRLEQAHKNIFVETIIDKYLIDHEKYKSLKISQKFPMEKIIKFLGEFNLPVGMLFEKLRRSNSLSTVTILILLITNNNGPANEENLNIYENSQIVKSLKIHEVIQICFQRCIWVLLNSSALSSQILELSLNLLLSYLTPQEQNKVPKSQIERFVQNIDQQSFWQLIFGLIKKKNDPLNEKIYIIFKTLVENITENFQRGINSILLEIIKKEENSLYQKINPSITDDSRMNHLQTILEYLSLTNNKIFLDEDTSVSLLSLPLTTTLWSLALKIIPRNDKILMEIIKKFHQQHYNTLGKQIMQFCEPLVGIRKLQSNHINWLEFVRKIRLEGRSILSIFVEKLKVCCFGGRNGLTMSSPEDTIKLEIADEFSKLVIENPLQEKFFDEESIKVLVYWYFINSTKQKGNAPATDFLFNLSTNVYKIFEKVTQCPAILPKFIRTILEVRKEGEIVEVLFEQKKLSSGNALELNKRFCQCFESLINLFCINDQLFNYFAFEEQGLNYILQKAGLSSAQSQTNHQETENANTLAIPEEEFLISEGLIVSSSKQQQLSVDNSSTEIKQQQFANNIQLVPNLNEHAIVNNNADWTGYKKGNKTKILFLPMNGPTYYEYPLYLALAQPCEVRSIKIGFPAASFEMNDKLVASPSLVLLEGGMDIKNMESMGEMEFINDDGYSCNGVKVFVLNLQRIGNFKGDMKESICSMPCYRIKYLKIVVKRPVVSFIEGQYSPLNGKPYTNLGCSISFLSILGDNFQKQKVTLLKQCKAISRTSALTILGTVINESNPQTVKKVSESVEFIKNFKTKFSTIKQLMLNYSSIVPNIVFSLGSSNDELGDWVIDKFLSQGNGDIQAKLLNQIVVSSKNRIYDRLDIFLKHILQRVHDIIHEADIEGNVKFSESISFIESFCKTLEESYRFGTKQQKMLHFTFKNIEEIIILYDRKYSSQEIKTLHRLLISLLYVKAPLRLSEDVQIKTLNLIWQNCSQAKPYFYELLASVLLNKQNKNWIEENDHEKTRKILSDLHKSMDSSSYKIVNSQMYLLWIISFNEREFLSAKKQHMKLYNKVKHFILPNFDIYDSMIKIIQNVVVGSDEDETQMASQLVEDVDLLVKRKDPNLQQLYVGILRLQKEVNVAIKGFDVDSQNSKRESFLTSKILNKAQIKLLNEKINKKIKFTSAFECESTIKTDIYQKLFSAMNASQFLILIKFKLSNGKNGYLGCYSPGKSFRSEEDSYSWEDTINYEKGAFIFTIHDGELNIIELADNSQPMLSLCGGEDEVDESLTFFNKSQIMKLPFKTATEISISIEGFTGAQVEAIEFFNGIVKPVSVEPKILASSSKAVNPFNLYRTSNIYVFPARITIEKFMSIIGIRGSCKQHETAISPEEILNNISLKSEDFIADIEIQMQEVADRDKNEEGYFPIMRIFDRYSELGGVNKVLEIGSRSIKDWQKAQRKKSFEHYMSELRNFVHLPNFFNHYIKNQQSISFLFEVASGMPDDPNNEKNWEEEQVKSSKFIYKILADIYKFDKSPQIRDMQKYSEFCSLILNKLAQISKEVVRSEKQQVKQPSKETQKQNEAEKTGNNNKQKKKKGTGYSSDNQNNSKWSANEWIQHRKNMNSEIQRVASIFVSFLDCDSPLVDPTLSEVIKNSCLLPLIESALRSGSLLDISKQADLFKNYLNIVKSLANNPATIDCLLDIDPKYQPAQTESIFKLLSKLHEIAKVFITCLKGGQENQIAAVIAKQIEKVYYIVEKAVKNISKKEHTLSLKQINSMPIGQAYRYLLEGLRFGYVDLRKGSGAGKDEYNHFYGSSIPKGSPPTAKILRLSQELADLSSSLPCEHTNSIFVRSDKTRIDVVKILIMGSKDTPYSNGAFMFDLFCDDTYPNNPPKMSITTTGAGKIRFNPNLYACGKVCLSLLGTWRGHASENWDAKISTLLQLLISTQGITMSEDLYFNEPGFEMEQGTPEGQKKNEAYANIVRLGNIRYAMNQQIKSPPKGFQEVVNRHFYVKRKQILEEVEKWIEQADIKQTSYTGLVHDHNTSWCTDLKNKGKYKELLLKQYNELKQLLNKLPDPNPNQKQKEEINLPQIKKKIKEAEEVKLNQYDVSYESQTKNQLKYQQDVMQDRWSRYIGAMGIEAVKKQSESKVVLIGLKSLGLQIAKNLVLSGLKELFIVDDVDYGLGAEEHFYMSDIKSKRVEDCIFKIKQLNPYMSVKWDKSLPNLQGFNTVVCTSTFDEAIQLSTKCNKLGIKFIYAQTCGVSGIYFSDLGKQFSVEDPTGEEPFEGMIKEITCDSEGIVKLLDGVKHPYQDGDYIVIDKVQGMKEKSQKMEQISYAQSFYDQASKNKNSSTINGKVFQIKVINWNSFSIGDTTNFQPYLKGGFCKNINIPKKLTYDPMEVCVSDFDKYLDPSVGIYDFQKMGDNYSVFACFQAYSEFVRKNNAKPKNWFIEHSEQFQQILQKILINSKRTQEQQESAIKFGRKYSLIAEAQLPIIGAYFGGLVSQQIIKAITNKYTPIKQFFTFHFNELIQQIPESSEKYQELQIKPNQIFPNLKIVIGRENSKKMEQIKTFVIGAGAIGCELLKNFAMLNMGAQGMITVTDPDHIETSNLTRQFLFRQKHVKKPKSGTAAATLLQMNPLLKGHISARLDKVSDQTDDIYSDEFFQAQNVVVNALDNVKARVYVDSRCVANSKPLFESGTLGPKGHVQVIIPHKTQNYGNQADPTEENQIPHCTLKMFPEETVHCIQWSRDIFGKVFTLNPKALKKVLQAKDINASEGQQKTTVIKMIKHKPTNFNECIEEAVRKFYKYFRNNVKQLLHTYPLDMKTKDGNLFWALPKRPPNEISEIDPKDPLHQKFIASYAVLLAKIYEIAYPKDFRTAEGGAKIMEIAKKVKAEDFVPNEEQSKKMKNLTEKEQSKKQSLAQPEPQTQQQHIEKAQQEQAIPIDKLQFSIQAEQFEKDEDSNGHIDLIYSMSNLRARNYSINECTWIEAKLKAGKIMAALSTTTSVVAALQTIEIVKLVSGSKVNRNAFINLAIPLIQISEPGEVPKHKIGKTEFTVWDTWEFSAKSIKHLLEQIEQKYDVIGYNIMAGGSPIYWEAMFQGNEAGRQELINRPLTKIFSEKTVVGILMKDKEGKAYEQIPRIIVTPIQQQ